MVPVMIFDMALIIKTIVIVIRTDDHLTVTTVMITALEMVTFEDALEIETIILDLVAEIAIPMITDVVEAETAKDLIDLDLQDVGTHMQLTAVLTQWLQFTSTSIIFHPTQLSLHHLHRSLLSHLTQVPHSSLMLTVND
jgi:hypothetical protein